MVYIREQYSVITDVKGGYRIYQQHIQCRCDHGDHTSLILFGYLTGKNTITYKKYTDYPLTYTYCNRYKLEDNQY